MTISDETIQQIGVIVGLISATGVFVGFGNKLKKWLSLRGNTVFVLLTLVTIVVYLLEGVISGSVEVDWLAGNVALIQPVYIVLKSALGILAKIRVGGAVASTTATQTVGDLPVVLTGVDEIIVPTDSVAPVTPADFQ